MAKSSPIRKFAIVATTALAVSALLSTSIVVQAVPVPLSPVSTASTDATIAKRGGGQGNGLTNALGHVLATIDDLNSGLQAGVQPSAPALGQVASSLGAALQAAGNTVGALEQGTVAGAGQTVGAAPHQVFLALLHLLTGGVLGSLANTLTG